VGISAGTVVLVGLLIVGGVFFVRKQKKKAAEEAGGYLSLDGSSSLIQ
jgi:LPXTG-motif cell wall-anchored protein